METQIASQLSVFDMLKIGIGPSSSHTLGPWRAAQQFLSLLPSNTNYHIKVELYGSIALTGKGHATDKAIIAGLSGLDPEFCTKQNIEDSIKSCAQNNILLTNHIFNPSLDLYWYKTQQLPYHSNGMKFIAANETTNFYLEKIYYSIGGGFIWSEDSISGMKETPIKFKTNSSADLQKVCLENNLSISDLVWSNEGCRYSKDEITTRMSNIWNTMKEAAFLGCHTEGILPGGLNVKRRASEINNQLIRRRNYSNADGWIEAMKEGNDFSKVLMRVSCIALAINEVNADMGRIVTAPTNGSAGVIPAVLFYYICFSGKNPNQEDIIDFLMTAAEIGKYFKTGATISAAAGGCQAEIGVSSAMAAAALTEKLGGSVKQVLMAAEIAAEHHLGLTCGPIGGLVQIPCIERNSMGAIKAITAAMIALSGNPDHAKVSLDNVIKTMKDTAEHMHFNYKETSLGGLATQVGVNIPEC